MLEELVGGAALLIGGAAILCSILEDENAEKVQELEHKTRKYENSLRQQMRELERIQALNNKAEQLELIQIQFLKLKQESDEAYSLYTVGRKHLSDLNKQIKQAFEKKNLSKEELKNYSKGTPEFNKCLQKIREYNAFIQKTIPYRDTCKSSVDDLHKNLQLLNSNTKMINFERKTLREANCTWRVCRECGHRFYMTSGELLFYKQKGFSFPSRCPGCRGKRKALL